MKKYYLVSSTLLMSLLGTISLQSADLGSSTIQETAVQTKIEKTTTPSAQTPLPILPPKDTPTPAPVSKKAGNGEEVKSISTPSQSIPTSSPEMTPAKSATPVPSLPQSPTDTALKVETPGAVTPEIPSTNGTTAPPTNNPSFDKELSDLLKKLEVEAGLVTDNDADEV